MPPRVPAQLVQTLPRPKTLISSFLVPFIHPQIRAASILSSLSDTPGAYSKAKRLGRGPSSGKGKTSGRGQKGQKARGKVPKQFNGGQTPESITHGSFGFTNAHSLDFQELNLDKLQEWITLGRIDPSRPITLREIFKTRLINTCKDGVKLLGGSGGGSNTPLKQPVHIIVSRASQSAIAAVEAAGGTVTTRYYTPLALTKIRQGAMHPYISLRWDARAIANQALIPRDGVGLTPEERVTGLGFQYRLPDPVGRKDLEYYRDVKNRGYLSHAVGERESPSLFWKTPLEEGEIAAIKERKGTGRAAAQRAENKLW